jgi:hypothetical protein
MNWQLVAILFTIAAFEGVRRLEPDELVLRCNPLGVWRVVTPLQLWRDWHLVSFLAPFFLTVVIPPPVRVSSRSDRDRDLAEFGHASNTILALRLLGGLDLFLLILGIPWAVSRFGAAGFLGSLAFAFSVSVATAITAVILLARAGLPTHAATRKALSFASPFSAPLAAEIVLSTRIRQCPRLSAISKLIGVTQFRAWIRPWAFDLESPRSSMRNAWLEEIGGSLSISERAGILDSAPEGCRLGERYCPRCGQKYLLSLSLCADCDGIQLRLRDQFVGMKP